MKISILRLIVVEEGEKSQVKGKENIFNNIIGENFSTLKEGDTSQGAGRIQNTN